VDPVVPIPNRKGEKEKDGQGNKGLRENLCGIGQKKLSEQRQPLKRDRPMRKRHRFAGELKAARTRKKRGSLGRGEENKKERGFFQRFKVALYNIFRGKKQSQGERKKGEQEQFNLGPLAV